MLIIENEPIGRLGGFLGIFLPLALSQLIARDDILTPKIST